MSDLTRRNILAGVSAFAALGSIPIQCSHGSEETGYMEAQKDHYDVIVMGGGFAGVTAARELGNAGYRVLIIEAANRLGGRSFTSEVSGMKVELGGGYIHWHQPHIWTEIERYGLEVGKSEEALSFKSISSDLDELCAVARDVFPRPHDPLFLAEYKKYIHLTIEDRLDELNIPKGNKELLEGFLSSKFRGFSEKGSFLELMRCYALTGYSGDQLIEVTSAYRIKEGTTSLINFMALDGGAQVMLATNVSKVIHSEQAVQVVTDNGVFRASALVCALPQNKWEDVGLSPLNHRSVNRDKNAKFYVKIRQEIKSIEGIPSPNNPIRLLSIDHADENGSMLVGYSSVLNGFDISNTDIIQKAVREYISDVTVEETYTYDWNNDPNIKGTHSIYRPEKFSQYFEEVNQTDNSIFYAGADIAKGWRGFIDGAVESGLTVGRMVKEHLQNSLLII